MTSKMTKKNMIEGLTKLGYSVGHACSWIGSDSYCQRYNLDARKSWAVSKYNETVGAWIEPTDAHKTLAALYAEIV